jgi:hypothetical protein
MRECSLGDSGSAKVLKSFIAGLVASVVPAVAGAAELRVTAPDECELEATLRADAERLTGAPISDASGMDFEIEVENHGGWRLRLVTIERTRGTRRVRELRGASCSEVTNAGAVALALAIQQASSPHEEPEPSADPSIDSTAPLEAPGSNPPPPREPQADRARPEQPANTEREPASFVLGAGLVVDSSVLPALAPGAGVELDVRYAGFRFGAIGTWLAPEHVDVDAERGGDFQLLAVGLLACREVGDAFVTPLACAGYELGSLQGEGTGVTRSKLGAALWQAARLEAGAAARFGSWGVMGRAGIAVPFERRAFVLDGTDLVHRPGGLSLRLYLGLDSTF